MEPTVVVGLVIKPHGVRGEVSVEPMTDSPIRFEPGSGLLWGQTTLTVVSSRPQGKRLLVRFEGVDDRSTAERLRGARLAVPASDRPPLPEGSYVASELIGFRVVTESGRELGRLEEVRDNPAHDLWVVDDRLGNETVIPAVHELIVSVDEEARLITVNDLPGLTEPG